MPATNGFVTRSLTPDVTIFSGPFSRFGLFKIGARATAVKLRDNSLLIFSPVAWSEEVESALEKLSGSKPTRVSYLVAPDREHYLQLRDYSQRFPEAKLIGVKELPEKLPGVTWHKVYGEAKYDNVEPGFADEFDVAYVSGHLNHELVLLHKASRTLIEADLLFNLPATEQYEGVSSSAGILGWLSPFRHLKADSGSHRWFNANMAAKDKPAFKREIQEIARWQFDRIVPCHGEVIETNAKETFNSAFKSFLDPATS
ncbi:hypothetical protein PYCC9005_003750 [Savitreella phatthalungensis]